MSGPQKFRKKPVVIEAWLYTGDPTECHAIHEWMGLDHDPQAGGCGSGIAIQTLEGQINASVGDWIIKGVAGEFYPCKPEIFAATYELAYDTPESVTAKFSAVTKGWEAGINFLNRGG